jgi:hypothetical protein
MRKNTWLETITAITFLIFVGVIIFYSSYPFKVTTLESIGIDSDKYCRGDIVSVEMKFQKHLDVSPDSITWYIVDGVVFELEQPGTARPKGDNHVISSKQIPHSILPGKYKMRVVTEYTVHPLHPIIKNTWDTPIFEVLGNEDCPENQEDEPSNTQQSAPNRPVINESSKPTTGSNTTPSTPNAGQSAQPVQVHQEQVQEQRGEPQTFTPEHPPTPVRDLLETVLKPVKGLL